VNRRPVVPCNEVGKRIIDAWSNELVYVDRPYANSGKTATEQILRTATTPLNHTIVSMFIEGLTADKRMLLDALASGHARKVVSRQKGMSISCINAIRQSLREKAVDHLV
jgi:hypothetical protein